MERLLSTLKNLIFVALLGAALAGCSGDDSSSTPAPTTGTLTGTVIEAGIDPALPAVKIAGASVAIFNAKTNAPVATVTTGSDGKYKKTLGAGNYYVKVSKQGYDSVPPTTLEPVPFAIKVGKTTTNNIEMFPATMTDTGWISGKVSIGDSGKGGVLVVADDGTTAYSALSNKDGTYVIYNVPVNAGAAYSVTSYLAGYTSSARTDVVVVLDSATKDVNLALTGDAMGTVPVNFNVISQTGVVPPENMVVSLLHPMTRETIPGLSQTQTYSSSISYEFTGVADGSYLVRATYANDTIVVDPDAIRKFGEFSVTVASGSSTPNPVDITATSAVTGLTPSNAMASAAPFSIDATTAPTFSWNAYPSASDYVVEVMDATTGTVIWGGFSGSGDTMVKNVVTTATSIVFNDDGLATSELLPGHVYRWRVYASKNDNSALGWHLISASEDQQGLLKIQ